LFQSEYAEQLGFSLREGQEVRFSGAGGDIHSGFGHPVTITVLGYSVDSMVYFTDHQGFSRNVLGREGWLHPFKFGLVHYDRKLYVSRYGD
jgi:hypothetical protein